MYHFFVNLDHQLFLFINHLPHIPMTDMIAMTLSAIGFSWIVWTILSVLLFIREERKDHLFFFPIILAGSLAGLVTEFTLKNIFGRGRPPIELGTLLVGPPLTDHSFPSGHATMAWALAVVLASKEPRAKYLFFAIATAISLSRIYLGYHYPIDITAGMLVGIAVGWVSLWFEQKISFKRGRLAKLKRKR